jgi:hypothetical protein
MNGQTIAPKDTAPDAQWHWQEGNKYALEGIKTLVLLNGGAAVALLTFLGNKGIGQSVPSLAWTLVSFGLGTMLGASTFVCAYLAQLQYGARRHESASFWHHMGYVAVGVSMLSFLVGLYFGHATVVTALGGRPAKFEEISN